MDGVYHLEESGMGFRRFSLSMHPDFKQPPFYEEYFKRWGLDGSQEAKACRTAQEVRHQGSARPRPKSGAGRAVAAPACGRRSDSVGC